MTRTALIDRWLHANHAHSIAQLHVQPRVVEVAVPPDLAGLAQRELSIPGRYHLTRPILATLAEPWWMRIFRWVAQRWNQFWHAIFGRVHVGRTEAAGIGDVLLIIVALLLIYVVVRLVTNLHFARANARTDTRPLAERPSPRALYKQACSAAAAGDYGAAVLLLFAATVAVLDREGAVDLTSSATVGDLRRTLRVRNAALLATFDAIAAPFVQRAYAERAIGESQWDHARTAYEGLGEG